MTARSLPWDALVIGGGPAGSGVATYLAREGRRVLLLERARFPREHVGESLLPGVLPYLEALGVRATIEAAGFERKEGQTFVWGKDQAPWHIDFRELDVHPHAYFVDRARFDHLLLEHAARSGAEVREGRAVTRVLFEGGRAAGVVHRGEGGEEQTERARFIVDASGQSALVARGAGLRRMVRGLKNTAVWAYWRGAGRLPGDGRAHILTASIPAGWVWVIPLGDRTSVGVVTSASTREARDRMGAAGWYEETVRACAPAWQLLASASRVTDVTMARDWSYRSRRFSGPGILLAGDAACFIDPILSTGVHLAMTSAFWAAACVHSALLEPKIEPFLRRFYDETYGAMYRELLTQVKAFYRFEGRRDSVFWTSKQILRAGAAVKPDLAFLFITAGLLRNAAMDAPHDALAQAREGLGERAALAGLGARAPGGRARGTSPPLVFRAGPLGSAELVRVRAEGLRLHLERHTPRGLLDRPRDGFFAIELADAARAPVGLAVVEARRRDATAEGRVQVTLLPYPVRPQDPAQLDGIQRSLRALAEAADDPRAPLRLGAVRARLRRALLEKDALPEGIFAVKAREHRGGGVAEPPLSAIFAATDPACPARRVYLVIEARVPPELVEIPVLRTRFVDVWSRPAELADGRALGSVPEAARLIARAAERLWIALGPASSRGAAFALAEEALTPSGFTPEGFSLLACGRLGQAGGESASATADVG